MKEYERLAGAVPLGEASDMTRDEADAIVSIFSAWFDAHVRGRDASRRRYLKIKGKSPPTLEQAYSLFRYKARRKDYPDACFDYPHSIYKWNKNPLSRKIHDIYGNRQGRTDGGRKRPASVRLDISAALDSKWCDRDFAARRKALDVKIENRRRARQAAGQGGNEVRRIRHDGHNPSLRQVDSEIHHRDRGCVRGGKRIQAEGEDAPDADGAQL